MKQDESTLTMLTSGSTYAYIGYLLAALPIGIAYFTIAVTGLSLSAGLMPIFLGFPLLLFVLLLGKGTLRMESALAAKLLNEPAPVWQPKFPATSGFWGRLAAELTDMRSWKGLLMMIVKMPIGIASFTVCVTSLSVSVGFIVSPIVRYILLQTISIDIYESNLMWLPLNITPGQLSFLYVAVGIVLLWAAVRIVRFMTKLSAGLVLFMAQETHV